MTDTQTPDKKRGRNRLRARLNNLKDNIQAAWPFSTALTVTGTGVAAAIVAVAAGAWWFFYQSETEVEVPDVVGQPLAIAEARLEAVGLNLGMTSEEPSDKPAGTVLRTVPAVGTEVDRGAGVNLVLARLVSQPPQPPQPPVPQPPAPQPPAAQPPIPQPPAQQPPAQQPPAAQPPVPQPPTPPHPTPPSPIESTPPRSPVILGVGRVDHPDEVYDDCDTGYRFNFSQQISMTEPGRVTYHWLRSDNGSGPVYYIDFTEPGTQVVTTWWQRTGEPGSELSGWMQIEILTPTEGIKGERINYSYTCPDTATSEIDNSAVTLLITWSFARSLRFFSQPRKPEPHRRRTVLKVK